MMQQPRLIHWTMLGFLSIAWGFAFYLIAVGLESFSPLTVVNRFPPGFHELHPVTGKGWCRMPQNMDSPASIFKKNGRLKP